MQGFCVGWRTLPWSDPPLYLHALRLHISNSSVRKTKIYPDFQSEAKQFFVDLFAKQSGRTFAHFTSTTSSNISTFPVIHKTDPFGQSTWVIVSPTWWTIDPRGSSGGCVSVSHFSLHFLVFWPIKSKYSYHHLPNNHNTCGVCNCANLRLYRYSRQRCERYSAEMLVDYTVTPPPQSHSRTNLWICPLCLLPTVFIPIRLPVTYRIY